jgi:hypothetical protein
MVLLGAAKNARHQASLVNRANCGGTAKKMGLPSTIGRPFSGLHFYRTSHLMPMTCVVSKTIQTQRYGYRATLGGV